MKRVVAGLIFVAARVPQRAPWHVPKDRCGLRGQRYLLVSDEYDSVLTVGEDWYKMVQNKLNMPCCTGIRPIHHLFNSSDSVFGFLRYS